MALPLGQRSLLATALALIARAWMAAVLSSPLYALPFIHPSYLCALRGPWTNWNVVECNRSSCSKSMRLSKSSCNVAFTRKAPRAVLSQVSPLQVEWHFVKSAGVLTPASACLVLSPIPRTSGLLGNGHLACLFSGMSQHGAEAGAL